jgi:hypothetical protein
MRFADVTSGLSLTEMLGERQNGPLRNAGIPGSHFEYELTWSTAVRDYDEPEDDHGHMVLFQTFAAPVPSFQSNGFSLFDMHGNISERRHDV